MAHYNSNLELLKRRDPPLAKRVEDSPSCEGLGEGSLEEFSTMGLSDAKLVAILGFGRGEHILKIIDETSPQTPILIIEQSVKAFRSALETHDLSKILSCPRLILSVGEDPLKATIIKLEKYFGGAITQSKIHIVEHKSSTSLSPSYYSEIKEKLNEAAEIGAQNIVILERESLLWQKNVLQNLMSVLSNPGADELFGKFNGIPAFIVSAGPSLDKNAHHLLEIKERGVIICVDAALKSLLSLGAHPHLVVSIDAKPEKYYWHFQGVEVEDVALVADAVVFSKTLKTFKGPIFMTNDGHPFIRWLAPYIDFKGYLDKGESVSTTCFDLACRMKATPIIFVGQDLAYPEGRTYAKEIPEEKKEREKKWMKEKGLIEVEGIGGGKLFTSRPMYNCLKWLEYRIEATQTHVIDATEGGAKIRGTQIMNLDDAIRTYCDQSIEVRSTLMECYRIHTKPSPKKVSNALDGLMNECKVVEQLAAQGKRLVEKLMREERIFPILSSLFQQIAEQKNFMDITRWSMVPLIQKMESLGDTLQSYGMFFDGVLNLAKILVDGISDGIKIVEDEYGECTSAGC